MTIRRCCRFPNTKPTSCPVPARRSSEERPAPRFDTHAADRIGDMRLQDHHYAALTAAMLALADRYCSGKLVSIIGGRLPPGHPSPCPCHPLPGATGEMTITCRNFRRPDLVHVRDRAAAYRTGREVIRPVTSPQPEPAFWDLECPCRIHTQSTTRLTSAVLLLPPL